MRRKILARTISDLILKIMKDQMLLLIDNSLFRIFLNAKTTTIPFKTMTWLHVHGNMATWQMPTQKSCILTFHDESTFRSGDVSHKRWIINEQASFFSKGQGRSHMISDFLIYHPSSRFFSLSLNLNLKKLRKDIRIC